MPSYFRSLKGKDEKSGPDDGMFGTKGPIMLCQGKEKAQQNIRVSCEKPDSEHACPPAFDLAGINMIGEFTLYVDHSSMIQGFLEQNSCMSSSSDSAVGGTKLQQAMAHPLTETFTSSFRELHTNLTNVATETNLYQLVAQSVIETLTSSFRTRQANSANFLLSLCIRNGLRVVRKFHKQRRLASNKRPRRRRRHLDSNRRARRRRRHDQYSTIQIDFNRGKVKNAYEIRYCWFNWFKLEKITAVIFRKYIRLLEKSHSLPTLECLEDAAQLPPDPGLSLSSVDEDISLEARIERLNSRLLSLPGVLPPNVKADLDKLLDDIDDLSSISSDENTSSDLSEDSDDELAGQRRFN